MYRMLYYPYVNPPHSVLLQALLYWDELSSIVPVSDSVRPSLRDLGEFYRPLSVDDAVGPEGIRPLVEELRAVLARVPWHELRPDPGPLTGSNRLYYGKLPGEIEYELSDMRAVLDVNGVMQGSERFLRPLLAVTAKHLAAACKRRFPKDETVTNTDKASAYDDAYSHIGSLDSQPCWLVNVGRLLPVPADDVPIQDVIEFRERFGDERGNLTREVRGILARLESEKVTEPYIPRELQTSLKRAVDDYAKARRSRHWSWVTIATSVTIGAASLAAAPLVLPMAATVLGPLGAIGIGLGVKDARKGPDRNFTYLYNLQKQFSVL
jgi:uncharacterized protein DUF6236